MQVGGLRTSIGNGHANAQVFDSCLGVFCEDIEVTVFLKDTGIQKLKLWLILAAAAVRFQQASIRILRLRILVQILHVGVRRGGIKIEVILFYIFAVISFMARKTKETLFQDRIAAIPERKCEAKTLMTVADTGNAILIPAIGAGASLVGRKIIPRLAVGAVILTYRTPGKFTHVTAPAFPLADAVL